MSKLLVQARIRQPSRKYVTEIPLSLFPCCAVLWTTLYASICRTFWRTKCEKHYSCHPSSIEAMRGIMALESRMEQVCVVHIWNRMYIIGVRIYENSEQRIKFGIFQLLMIFQIYIFVKYFSNTFLKYFSHDWHQRSDNWKENTLKTATNNFCR